MQKKLCCGFQNRPDLSFLFGGSNQYSTEVGEEKLENYGKKVTENQSREEDEGGGGVGSLASLLIPAKYTDPYVYITYSSLYTNSS